MTIYEIGIVYWFKITEYLSNHPKFLRQILVRPVLYSRDHFFAVASTRPRRTGEILRPSPTGTSTPHAAIPWMERSRELRTARQEEEKKTRQISRR